MPEMDTAPRIRRFSSEHAIDPASYTSSYCLYAHWDGVADTDDWLRRGGEIDALYADGYIPFSNFAAAASSRNLFYKARSLRFDLSRLVVRGPRRRLDQHFAGRLGLSFAGLMPLREIEQYRDWERFRASIPRWAPFMPAGRLDYVLTRSYLDSAYVVFDGDGALAAVTLAVETDSLSHVWFDFFDKTRADLRRQNLHSWIHSRALIDARARGKSWLYLGSLYGEGARYKTHGLAGWALALGDRWVRDDELDPGMFARMLARDGSDGTTGIVDAFKTSTGWEPGCGDLPPAPGRR